MRTTFTLDEVLAMQRGEISDDLQAKIAEAETFEKSKTLRQNVIDRITANASETIASTLTPLKIPKGVSEIALVYDLAPETCDFTVKPAGVSVKMIDEAAVSNDIIRLVTAAERATENKNPQPLSFIKKTLGSGTMQNITASRDFENDVKPVLDELYTNVKAVELSEGVNEIPGGDKVRLSIKYRHDLERNADTGDTTAGWLAPYVTCSKTYAGSTKAAGDSKRRPTVKPPEPFKSWEAFAAAGETDDQKSAQAIFDVQINKWGADWKDHISPTNALRQAKHEFFMQRQAEVYADHGTDW